MLGRGVAGLQFWAVPASSGDAPLLVLGLVEHEFARAVLAVEDPAAVAAEFQS